MESDKCEYCDGKKLLRIIGTNFLVPCLKCKDHDKSKIENNENKIINDDI
jgi:hypothetical protein